MSNGDRPKLLACSTPGEQQQRQAGGDGGQDRSDEHYAHHADHDRPAAAEIAEPPDHRGQNRGRQQVRGYHPARGGRRDIEVGLDLADDRNDQSL
jgi:hypothetical protein